MKRKILSITGTRSDYGLMLPVFEKIIKTPQLELVIIITGMHLLPEFSSSLQMIYDDELCKYYKVSMLLGDDSNKAMSQSLGMAIMGISSIIEDVKPDIVLLQGDRGEMLAGAIAAAHMNIPIVHMSGGDYSGSIDDSIRNSISKFSHIHLTTCQQSSDRLIKMGESANRIIEVGEPGLDVIKNMDFIPAERLAEEYNFDLAKPLILATQHSVTTESEMAAWQIEQTLQAIDDLGIQTIFTYPNSDSGGREMIKILESYKNKPYIRIIPSLGSLKYLSLMKISSMVLGNSSSGIFESPSFKIPVINIGTRQHGRLKANNVIDVDYNTIAIKDAIQYILSNPEFRESLSNCINPYGNGTTAEKTIEILVNLKIIPELISKWFNAEILFI